ncbi:MAG: hypothetical protein ACOC11_02470 [Prolixibacteraceae bacterium]
MRSTIVILILIFFASCENYKEDAERLQMKVDSLQNVAEQKDESIENFLNDFTEIQANLDSIKKMEELLAVPEEPEQAISENRKQRIMADIATMNRLLQKNRELISSLRSRINSSNFQTGKMESMVNELEQLTQNLQENIQEKDEEIANLTEKVEEQSEDISRMGERIEEMEQRRARQLDSLKLQEAELNKAYYIVGSVKELKEQGIVEREGGILGIGRTPVIKEDFPKEMFTEVDIREFRSLSLNAKKADVVSVHPIDSYHIAGEDIAESLVIDYPEEFWSASRYLVVVTK